MDPGQRLLPPETARDAVQGEEDLVGLPILRVEQLLEIPGRLMEVEDECMLGNHGTTLRDSLKSVRIAELAPRQKAEVTDQPQRVGARHHPTSGLAWLAGERHYPSY